MVHMGCTSFQNSSRRANAAKARFGLRLTISFLAQKRYGVKTLYSVFLQIFAATTPDFVGYYTDARLTIPPMLSMALGTNELISTNSGSFEPSALRSEQ